MNRQQRPTIGGPSKATAATLCQKCLKRDIHYSYECKAVAQERPYVSRPSRTQQLLNPKLVPKLTSDIPQDLLRKKGVADEQLAKAEVERARKRERLSEEPEGRSRSKKLRSASSSISVSTISTDRSRSTSPHLIEKENDNIPQHSRNRSESSNAHSKHRSPSCGVADSEKKRRRASFSSPESHSSDEDRQLSRQRGSSRSTRRRIRERSPLARGRPVPGDRTKNESPYRNSGNRFNDHRGEGSFESSGGMDRGGTPPRQRSLSPFSKRLALTQSMNTGR